MNYRATAWTWKKETFQTMLNLCREVQPLEACGLLGGIDTHISSIIPVTNRALNPHRSFVFDGSDFTAGIEKLNKAGLDWLGIFHSHPNGSPYPSKEDGHHWHYPELLYVIAAKEDHGFQSYGYKYIAGHWTPQSLEIISIA
jgi:proteasome lid subunit RPN8/RPN11